MNQTILKRIRNDLNSFAKYICLFVVLLILVSSVKGMVNNFYWAAIVCAPFLCGIWLFGVPYIKIDEKCLIIIQSMTHILSLIIMLFITRDGVVEYSWDWGQLLQTATSLTLDGVNDNPIYYLRYPNNQFWLSFMTVFFRVVRIFFPYVNADGLKLASMLLSIAFVRLTYVFVFLISKELFGIRKARIIDIVLMLYLPLYLWSYFAYTDTSGMLATSIIMFLFLKVKNHQGKKWEKIRDLILLSFVVAMIGKIKIMAAIIFIGMFLAELLNSDIKIKEIVKKYTLIMVCCLIFSSVLGMGTSNITKLDVSQSEKYEFPPIHWITMGMTKNGAYNQEIVNFAASLPDYDARKELELDMLTDIIKELGLGGTLKHMLDTKMTVTWGDSTLQGNIFVARKAVYPNSLVQKIFGISGKYHKICLLWSWMCHMLILSGCMISMLRKIRNKKPVDFMQLSIVGICVFLCIWECKSRYLITYVPTLFLCAAEGWIDVLEKGF